MRDQTILKIARQHYASGSKDPLPFPLSEMWEKNRQKMAEAVPGFTSATEAVHWAQRHQNSGFDHRYQEVGENEKNIIAQKEVLLEERFHGFDFDSSRFKESCYSLQSSIIMIPTPIGGTSVSNALFWHLNQYLVVTSWLRAWPTSVVEIGGGYGGLARLFVFQRRRPFYTIVDLPESLFFAECFLRLDLGMQVAIAYAGCTDCRTSHDLKLVTPYRSSFTATSYDVAVAAASLQEMEAETVKYWLSFVSSRANHFYSLNYASTPLVGDGEGPPGVLLGAGWKRERKEVNSAVVTVDAKAEWVELLYRKGKAP